MVKFFSAASAADLETAINTFLGDDYEVVSIDYFVRDGWYQAILGYKAVATAEATT